MTGSRYTNERSLALSDEQFDAETALLKPLRMRHAHEIVASGLAGRAIATTVGSNAGQSEAKLNEGSEIMPIRMSMHFANVAVVHNIAVATNLVSPEFNIFDANLFPLAYPNDPSRRLILCRSEEVPSEHYRISPDVSLYTLGVQLSPTAAGQYKTDTLKPVPGIEVDDLRLIVRQLGEVAAFATENSLISVDPATLIQCAGEPYCSPTSPYFQD